MTMFAFSRSLFAEQAFVTKLNSSGGVIYSTYLGGWYDEQSAAVKVDSSGRAVVLGTTTSFNYPTTEGAAFRQYREGTDLFVTKLNEDGSGLAFSTFLGGTGRDRVSKCVTWSDYVYLTGASATANFPVTPGAYDEVWNGNEDVFVSQLNGAGEWLMATFLGGTRNDVGIALAVDDLGAIYVTGTTESTDFPTTPGAYRESFGSYSEIFVAKISADGSDLNYSTFINSAFTAGVSAIAVGGSGNCFIGGTTNGPFPVTPGAFDTLSQSYEGYVTQLNPQGSGLVYSTYLGGGDYDNAYALLVDSQDQAYVLGDTSSTNFPVTPNAYKAVLTGLSDNFVTKLNASGSALVFSTLLGSDTSFVSTDIALAPNGNIYCIGWGSSFPTTANAYSPNLSGDLDGIIAMVNSDGTALPYASFFGGNGYDFIFGAEVDDSGSLWLAGYTNSSNLPTTSDAVYQNNQGGYDGFLAKFENNSTLAYSTYLGGAGFDDVRDLALDDDQNVYVAGVTYSSDFMDTSSSSNHHVFVLRFGCLLPRITVQPLDQNGCLGQALSMRVLATGDDLSYQWFKDEQPIAGANAAILTLSSPVPADAGAYVCTISTICGSVDSAPVQLVLNASPLLVLQPVGVDACPGEAAQFEVQATGAAGLSYRWRHDDHLIPGATTATLQLGSLSYDDAGTYSCLVSNGLCSTVSEEVELRVLPHLTLQAYTPVICSGDDTSLEVAAIGSGVLAYQWPLNGALLDGETSSVLALASFSSADTGLYDCLVSEDPAPQESTTFQVSVTDGITRNQITKTVQILVPAQGSYLDYDGDGCNTLADLYLFAPSWQTAIPQDPNGDGQVNVLDFLYFNTQDPWSCQP